MDRQIVYPGQILPETTLLQMAKDAMIGSAKLAAAMLGTSTIANGFSVTPTGPASLQIVVAPGEIYALANIDSLAFSTLPADTTHSILKQGILLDGVTLSCPAPTTTGQSINYLVQVTYQDQDSTPVLLPYYNSANPALPYSGMGNNGLTQNTSRKGVAIVQVKAGASAATGSQVTPAPDSGYVGLYVATVAFGQTTITSGNITQYSGAPLLPSGVLQSIQGGNTTYALDVGPVNACAATFFPAITALQDGLVLRFKASNANTGATTFSPNGITAAPVVGGNHSALQGGEIVAGGVVWVQWSSTLGGGSWVLVESSGGDLQVSAATKSMHAVQQSQLGNYNAMQLITGSAGLTAGRMYLVTGVGVTPTLPILANSTAGDTVTVAARVDTTIAVSGTGSINNPAVGSVTSFSMRAGEQVQFVSNGSISWNIANYSVNPQYQTSVAFTTGGTSAALTLTPIPPIAAYATSVRFRVKFSLASTGTDTLNVSALGTKLLKQYDSTGAKVAAVFAANQLCDVEYDGTDFVLLDQLPAGGANLIGIQGLFKNLAVSSTGLSALVTCTVDEIMVENTSNQYQVLRAVSVAPSLAAAGANGLDTGTSAASTWYSVWIINNGTTTAGLLSLSATAPTMPSGYTFKARVGWVRTDATGNKYPLKFLQSGRNFQYAPAAGTNLTNARLMTSGALGNPASPATWSAVAIANFVPTTASRIRVYVTGYNGGTIAAPSTAYDGLSSSATQGAPIMTSPPAGNSASNSIMGDFVIESANIYYASGGSASGLTCVGFEDSI